jgi:hypothetical protein
MTVVGMQEASHGEPWVSALESADYSGLSLEMRMAALVALVHLALEGPSVRNCLDARLDEAQRVRKAMWDDAKVTALPLPPSTTGRPALASDSVNGWLCHIRLVLYMWMQDRCCGHMQAEKRRRQMEAAERARRAAAEAQRALEKFRQQNNLVEGAPAGGHPTAEANGLADVCTL